MKFATAALLAAISILGATASIAGAADSLYWSNYNDPSESISVANLDGSGAGRDLFTGTAPRGGTVSAPAGLTLDPANGWVYWSTTSSTPPSTITRGSIDGCDAAATCATDLYPLLVGGPTVSGPGGPAIDVANGLMYWINASGVLVRASLDGSGAVNETVNTTGASALGGGGSGGLAIDKRTNRIYWTSDDFGNPGKISWANLDGSGGGDLNTTGANTARPWGLALDTASNRVYWANYNGADGNNGSISWANLDGTGGGNLYTSASPGCSTLSGPNGVAIDRAANKVYWANYAGNTLGSASLDGSSACATVGAAGATLAGPDEVAILKTPLANEASSISGTPLTGKALTCGSVTWGSDSPEANFYRSPRSVSFQWRKDGAVISGATAATFTPTSAGSYDCAAVGTNASGSTAATSSALVVKRTVGFATPKFKHKIKGAKMTVTGSISPKVSPAVSKADCSGTVALKFVLKKKTIASKRVSLKYKSKKCSAAVSFKVAKKYAGKKVKLTISIAKSTKLTAKRKTVSVRL